MVHPGTTFTSSCRGARPYGNKDIAFEKKRHTRTETCFAMRILALAWYCIMHVLIFAVILLGCSRDPVVSLLTLREWGETRSRTRQYTMTRCGQLVTDMKHDHNTVDDLVEAIEGKAQIISVGPS